MNEIRFQLTAGTDIGLIRSNNEDNFIVGTDLTKQEWFVPQQTDNVFVLGEKGCVLIVADGMGGLNAGEIASAIAIETLQSYFAPDSLHLVDLESKSIERHLKEAIVAADKKIKEESKRNKDTRGMGTTIVIAWMLNNRAYIAWCGDSRAYSFHPQAGLRQLSKDHSYVQELVDHGKLDPQFTFDHPDSNIVTRSLGDSSQAARPDFVEKELFNDEIIVLCSDGLSGIVRDERIGELLLKEQETIENCKTALIQEALAAGGYDNITVALFKVISGLTMFDSDKLSDNNDISYRHKKKKKRNKVLLIVVSFLILLLVAVIGMKQFDQKLPDKQQETNPDPPVEEVENDTVTSSAPESKPVRKDMQKGDSVKPAEVKKAGEAETSGQDSLIELPPDTASQQSGFHPSV